MEGNLNNDKAGPGTPGPKAPTEKKEKQVKIKLLRPCTVGKDDHNEPIIAVEGTELEVSESLAKELCDKGFPVPWPFSGERDKAEAEKAKSAGQIFRAKRL